MNVEKFVARLSEMKVSEAQAAAKLILAMPDSKRGLALLKLLSILVMASEKDGGSIKVEAEAKAASATPSDSKGVAFI